jgi:hypothetical protein
MATLTIELPEILAHQIQTYGISRQGLEQMFVDLVYILRFGFLSTLKPVIVFNLFLVFERNSFCSAPYLTIGFSPLKCSLKIFLIVLSCNAFIFSFLKFLVQS